MEKFSTPQIDPLVLTDYDYVAQYANIASKENVIIKPTSKKHWWFKLKNDEGFCGMIVAAKNKVRLKAMYLHPEYRGKGLGIEMIKARMRYAKWLGYKKVETLTVHPHMYDALGFVRVKMTAQPDEKHRRPHGIWLMTKYL